MHARVLTVVPPGEAMVEGCEKAKQLQCHDGIGEIVRERNKESGCEIRTGRRKSAVGLLREIANCAIESPDAFHHTPSRSASLRHWQPRRSRPKAWPQLRGNLA